MADVHPPHEPPWRALRLLVECDLDDGRTHEDFCLAVRDGVLRLPRPPDRVWRVRVFLPGRPTSMESEVDASHLVRSLVDLRLSHPAVRAALAAEAANWPPLEASPC